MNKSISKTQTLIECALLIAMGTVLAQIKIFTMPQGGSVTLVSMLPFILISLRHGTKWGLLSGLVNAGLQMLLGFYPPPVATFGNFVAVVMLDYVVAFTALGLAGFFAKFIKNKFAGITFGVSIVLIIRFLCSFLSGMLIWGSYQEYYEWAVDMPVALYSFIYNGSYMIPELILTLVATYVLFGVPVTRKQLVKI